MMMGNRNLKKVKNIMILEQCGILQMKKKCIITLLNIQWNGMIKNKYRIMNLTMMILEEMKRFYS
jgi:hypothetical protein